MAVHPFRFLITSQAAPLFLRMGSLSLSHTLSRLIPPRRPTG